MPFCLLPSQYCFNYYIMSFERSVQKKYTCTLVKSCWVMAAYAWGVWFITRGKRWKNSYCLLRRQEVQWKVWHESYIHVHITSILQESLLLVCKELILFVLTLKVLNFWKFTSYCSLKPLWSGMGEVVPARTSPTLHPPSPPTVHQLSRLALWELIDKKFNEKLYMNIMYNINTCTVRIL